ncbi:MAG: UDP-N-acetylmuramate dehydrogenase [Chloroflexi bacterium]|nr:UDP-N-acetylmuramate dehydrogenase [Chloroflexota bacterium]
MAMADFKEKLADAVVLLNDEPMARHTTFRIGGPAELYTVARDAKELRIAVTLAQEWVVPYLVLGAGSNVLVGDEGIGGLVINNKGAGGRPLAIGVQGRDEELWVESGMSLARLARETAQAGWEGVEWAVGIPGTVGGGIVFNAGAHGCSVAQVLDRVRVLMPQGRVEEWRAEELGLAYRRSRLSKGDGVAGSAIILEASFRLRRASRESLHQRLEEYEAYRRRTQPHQASAGSVFKNPLGYAAGWLIQEVGLKGYRIGDAQFSPLHANFIVNLGQATAVQVKALMALAQERVLENFGVALEPEIRFLGRGEVGE